MKSGNVGIDIIVSAHVMTAGRVKRFNTSSGILILPGRGKKLLQAW